METNFTFTFNNEMYVIVAFLLNLTVAASVVIICESVLVIVIICRTTSLHTNTDIIVASLCATDILLSLAYVAHSVIGVVLFRANENVRNCINSLVMGISLGTTFISYTHLGFVAVDRYILISHPFYYIKKMTKERNLKVILAIWMIGLVYMAIPVVAYTDSKYHRNNIMAKPPLEYSIVSYIGYIINASIASTCYFKIARVAFQHKKAANARRLQNGGDNGEIVLTQNRKAAMKSVKFFAVSFGLFLAFTSPFLIIPIINIFREIPLYLYILKGVMYLLNSLLNCLIYAFMRKEFSKSLRSTVTNVLQRCKKRS